MNVMKVKCDRFVMQFVRYSFILHWTYYNKILNKIQIFSFSQIFEFEKQDKSSDIEQQPFFGDCK